MIRRAYIILCNIVMISITKIDLLAFSSVVHIFWSIWYLQFTLTYSPIEAVRVNNGDNMYDCSVCSSASGKQTNPRLSNTLLYVIRCSEKRESQNSSNPTRVRGIRDTEQWIGTYCIPRFRKRSNDTTAADRCDVVASSSPFRWWRGAYRFQVDGVRVDRPCSMDCGAVLFCLYTFTGARTQTHTRTHTQTPTQVHHGGGDRDVDSVLSVRWRRLCVHSRRAPLVHISKIKKEWKRFGFDSLFLFPPGRRVRKKTRKSSVVSAVPSCLVFEFFFPVARPPRPGTLARDDRRSRPPGYRRDGFRPRIEETWPNGINNIATIFTVCRCWTCVLRAFAFFELHCVRHR